MEFSVELKTFLLIMVTGAFLGVLFDAYRVLRRRFKPPWLITSVSDLIYCLLATGIAFAVLLYSNWGELRFYVVIALFSGVLLYYRLASRQVMKFIIAFLKIMAHILRVVQRVIILTMIRPVVLITRTILWPGKFMSRKYKCWYKRWQSPPPPPPPS